MNTNCLYCENKKSEGFGPSYFPDTHFRDRTFSLIRCFQCGLLQLNPLLTQEDLAVLYPPSYQGSEINLAAVPATRDNTPTKSHFPFSTHFDLLARYAWDGPILDFGCGDGNFVANALQRGLNCDGLEYDPAQVKRLANALPNAIFFAFEDFINRPPERKYAAIRLSNVLEHLTAPRQQLGQLIHHLREGGVFLIEGPLENNPNLAFLFRKTYFILKKKCSTRWTTTHPPFHVCFSHAKNQRAFFAGLGLAPLHFEVRESEWPFPGKLSEARTLGELLKFFLARASVILSSFVPDWGNVFLYAGTPKRPELRK